MDIILTANSPGEILGWVPPIVKVLKDENKNIRIFLFLLPCPYATGKEFQIAANIKGIYKIFKPHEYLLYLFFGMLPDKIKLSKQGAILHLGGDILHSALLSRRLQFPAFAYLWGNKQWDKDFYRYFVPDKRQKDILIERGVSCEKIVISGNLLADTIALSETDGFTSNKSLQLEGSLAETRITFLPGSRPHEIRFIAPFFLMVAEIIKKEIPNAGFYLPLSPFVEIKQLKEAISKKPWKNFDGTTGNIKTIGLESFIITKNNITVKVLRGCQYKIMQESDLILSIPGTKCGEAGYLNRPMIVILPFNKPEELPCVGVAGWLKWFPVIGPLIKRLVILNKLKNWNAFVAQPNIIARKEIVPEIKGVITAEEVAFATITLLKDPQKLKNISMELNALYHNDNNEDKYNENNNMGAAQKIAKEILNSNLTVPVEASITNVEGVSSGYPR